jgi:hypothetical protein
VGRRRAIRLWLPLFLLWPLMLPLTVLAALVAARMYGVATAGILRAAWQLASGLRGTNIEVDSPEIAFRIRII